MVIFSYVNRRTGFCGDGFPQSAYLNESKIALSDCMENLMKAVLSLLAAGDSLFSRLLPNADERAKQSGMAAELVRSAIAVIGTARQMIPLL